MTMPMPEDAGITGIEGGNEPGGDDVTFNPKWENVLSQVPAEFHAKLAPELHKWDRGVQQRFQEVAPWKEVMGSGLDPAMVQQAITLAQSMQSDPRGVYDAMAKHYNFSPEVQAAIEDEMKQQEDVNPWEASYKQLESKLDMVTRVMVQNYEKEQQAARDAAEDAELEKAFIAASKKYGPAWNENIAMKLLQGFDSVEEAYDFYLQGGQRQPQQQGYPAPRVMGTGSNFPQYGNKSPADMNDSERVQLIARMLEDQKRAAM